MSSLERLVQYFVDKICSTTSDKHSLLLHFASNTGLSVLTDIPLTQYHLDPLSADNDGNTPLHHAALGGEEEVAELLITKYKCPVDYIIKLQTTNTTSLSLQSGSSQFS